MIAQYMPQQRRKRRERRQFDMAIGRHKHPGAGRSVEHPGRKEHMQQAREAVSS
jgi:hypothetical protein